MRKCMLRLQVQATLQRRDAVVRRLGPGHTAHGSTEQTVTMMEAVARWQSLTSGSIHP